MVIWVIGTGRDALYPRPMRRAVLLLMAVALVASACGGDDATGQVRGGEVEAELDALVAAAEDVRGLEFIEPPEIVLEGVDKHTFCFLHG